MQEDLGGPQGSDMVSSPDKEAVKQKSRFVHEELLKLIEESLEELRSSICRRRVDLVNARHRECNK